MSIVPVSAISSPELLLLGNNVLPQARRDARNVHAVNRALAIFDEGIDRLYRRTQSARPRAHRRRAA